MDGVAAPFGTTASVRAPQRPVGPWRKCPPAWRPPPLLCPGAYRPLRGSVCGKQGKPGFSAAVGGSGAGPACPWRRNKGGGGGRRPTPEDIRRKGHAGPAPDPPTTAPGKLHSTHRAYHAAGRRKKNRFFCRGGVNRVAASGPCRDRCDGDIRRPAAVAMAAPRLPAMVLEPRRKRVTLPGSPLRP